MSQEPFYLLSRVGNSQMTGNTNLLAYYGLENAFRRFTSKRVKEPLSSFMSHLPGADPVGGDTLRSLIDKPPPGPKDLQPLGGMLLTGFRLHPGPLPEQFRQGVDEMTQPTRKRRSKKRKHKREAFSPDVQAVLSSATNVGGQPFAVSDSPTAGEMASPSVDAFERREKKRKRAHGEDSERKKKKDKKKKKKRTSPLRSTDSGSIR